MDTTASILERAIGPVPAGLMRSLLFSALCGLAFLGTTSAARADEQTIDANPGAIVRVNLREGDVTVRTWNRPQIAIDGDPSTGWTALVVRCLAEVARARHRSDGTAVPNRRVSSWGP